MRIVTQIAGAIRGTAFRTLRALQDVYYGRWGTYRIEETGDIPEHGVPGVLYLVGDDGSYWLAAMRCPCGCKTILEMNLLEDDEPVWRLGLDAVSRPTLAPSVWPREGCGAHFHLRRGKIHWC